MNSNNGNLGKIIKQQRVMADLTLQQLSAMSGVSPSYLARIEKGTRFPSARILQKIAKPLDIEEVQLFISAGFLSRRSSTGVESLSGRQLDPYVAMALAQEPLDVQRAAIGMLSILKTVAKSETKQQEG